MRVLFIAEIVGGSGRYAANRILPGLDADFVIANANGAAQGFGLSKKQALTLRKSGIDILTGGEYLCSKKDLVNILPKSEWILRPENFPKNHPGKGWTICETPFGKIGIITLIGQSGYAWIHGNNPFECLEKSVLKIKEITNTIVLNFHAMTTAEKRTMAFFADGMVSAVIGSGTRCQTADAGILPKGTACITDAGRTGSRRSVFGMDSAIEKQMLITKIHERSKDGWGDLRFQGILIDIDCEGRAVSADVLDIPVEGD